jgi:hypothetical protein
MKSPTVYDCFDEPLKVSQSLITKYIEQKNLDDSRYSLLQITNEGKIRAIAENKSVPRGSGIFHGFASVTIAGACFKDSLLFRSFSQRQVRFVEEAWQRVVAFPETLKRRDPHDPLRPSKKLVERA